MITKLIDLLKETKYSEVQDKQTFKISLNSLKLEIGNVLER